MVTGKTREEQLREWQASQGRGKLSDKQGGDEASKENIPQQVPLSTQMSLNYASCLLLL